MLQAIKRIVFWTYARGSWQYDILCIVILCFIFLTPKAVFDGTAFLDEGQDRIPGRQEELKDEKQASVELSEIGDEGDLGAEDDVAETH